MNYGSSVVGYRKICDDATFIATLAGAKCGRRGRRSAGPMDGCSGFRQLFERCDKYAWSGGEIYEKK